MQEGPKFTFITEKEADGTYTVGILLGNIPNKRLAKFSMKLLKEAIDKHMVVVMGQFAIDDLVESKQKEKH